MTSEFDLIHYTALREQHQLHLTIDLWLPKPKVTEIGTSQYSTVVLTVVRVMIAKYRKSGIWGYRSSLTPEPVELK